MRQVILLSAFFGLLLLSSCGAFGKSKCTECPEWTENNETKTSTFTSVEE